jgi:hypothetical protein
VKSQDIKIVNDNENDKDKNGNPYYKEYDDGLGNKLDYFNVSHYLLKSLGPYINNNPDDIK